MSGMDINGKAKVLLDGTTIKAGDVEVAIDDVLKELHSSGDTEGIDRAITSLIGMSKFSIFYLSKALHGYNLWWVDTDQDEIRGDNFYDYVISEHGFNNRLVVERYVSLWSHYERNTLPKEIKERPLSEQIAIVKVLESGKKFTKNDWGKLTKASNGAEVRRILRKIQGKKPSKGSYEPHLQRDGTIVVYHQGMKVVWGKIKLPNGGDAIEQRVLEKMRTRAINGLGLIVD